MEKKWINPEITSLDVQNTENSTQPDREEDGSYGQIFAGTGVVGENGKPAGTECDLCS